MKITNKIYSTVQLKVFLTAILFAGVCLIANLGVARADALVGKEELASIAALLTKDTCVTECASDDWKVRPVPFPAGYKPPSGSVEQLYLAVGKNSFFCGSRGCISAYVLREAARFVLIKEGWNLGYAEKIQANEILAATQKKESIIIASALSVPHLLDNMDTTDILNKQVFKNPPQLKLELLSVAAKERNLGIDRRNSLPEDVCYTGVSDALAAQAGKDFVNLALKDLASSVFQTSIDLISTGSPIGDFLLKFGAQMTSSAMLDKPLTEAAILFVTKKSVGYITSKSTKSYILEKAASSLYEKSYKDLLADEELIAWKLSGSNKGSKSQTGELAPLTNINAEIFYSPYTHYTTVIVGATCNLVKGGTQKNTYILRYKVIETESKSAKIVDGTLRVFLVPHSTPALSGNVAPLTIPQSITSSPVPSTPKIGKIIDTRVIGSGNGCSCTFELANSNVSAGLNQSILFGADYRMTDGKAWMNINGRDVELFSMGSKITSNENDPVRPMSPVYSGDGMTASVDYRQIDSCPPEPTQCEVNRYDITVTLETGGLRETVKGNGSCGC